MAKHETLHFQYESIGNLVRLLVTIQFENNESERDVFVFHERFRNEPDELFEKFLTDLYPSGGTVGEDKINGLVSYIRDFIQKDDASRDYYVKYDKHLYNSYVYFKPDKTVQYVEFGGHANCVTQICCDFFKDFSKNDLDLDYLRRFILDNFEIKSDNTTIERVSEDAPYIAREILMQRGN